MEKFLEVLSVMRHAARQQGNKIIIEIGCLGCTAMHLRNNGYADLESYVAELSESCIKVGVEKIVFLLDESYAVDITDPDPKAAYCLGALFKASTAKEAEKKYKNVVYEVVSYPVKWDDDAERMPIQTSIRR